MKIETDSDYLGTIEHRYSKHFLVMSYENGGLSFIPKGFFRNFLDEEIGDDFTFQIGHCSWLGVGSSVKYDGYNQSLRIGRFVAAGLRLKFLLNGQHEMRTISTYMFGEVVAGLRGPAQPQYGDTVVKNDIWIGDEVMMLGGSTIENGCVIGARSTIPPNFKSEPYGIYAGSPAKLIRFRFPESVRAALVDLAWWNLPLSWIGENNDLFLTDLTQDSGKSLEIISYLKERRPS